MQDYKIFRIDILKQYNAPFSDYVIKTMYPGVIRAEKFIGEDDE